MKSSQILRTKGKVVVEMWLITRKEQKKLESKKEMEDKKADVKEEDKSKDNSGEKTDTKGVKSEQLSNP